MAHTYLSLSSSQDQRELFFVLDRVLFEKKMTFIYHRKKKFIFKIGRNGGFNSIKKDEQIGETLNELVIDAALENGSTIFFSNKTVL